jgi:predicted GNAT family N-acyltransferase
VIIQWFFSVPFFSDLTPSALSLRREVFVEEQGVPLIEEFDQKDSLAIHLVGIHNGSVVTTQRQNTCNGFVQISRFVVRKSFRGLGIGKAMLDYGISVARLNGCCRLCLEAQIEKIQFYQKFGFVEYGDIFYDAGMAHLRMKNY